jgi:hypothetical protein
MAFSKAIAVHPTLTAAYRNRDEAARRLGRTSEARDRLGEGKLP